MPSPRSPRPTRPSPTAQNASNKKGEALAVARLKGKIILVTGAAGAIGSAIAHAVTEQGGVAITSDLAGRGPADHTLAVTSESDWQRGTAAIEASAGGLDGLVQ